MIVSLCLNLFCYLKFFSEFFNILVSFCHLVHYSFYRANQEVQSHRFCLICQCRMLVWNGWSTRAPPTSATQRPALWKVKTCSRWTASSAGTSVIETSHYSFGQPNKLLPSVRLNCPLQIGQLNLFHLKCINICILFSWLFWKILQSSHFVTK